MNLLSRRRGRKLGALAAAAVLLAAVLERSSPSSVASRIEVPTLLIQGEDDSLFGLDQADANDQAIRRNGAPVDMVWFAGGHDGGNQETSRITQLTTGWFQRWLAPRHRWSPADPTAATGQPAFAVTRDLGYDPSSGNDVLGAVAAGHRGTAAGRPGDDPDAHRPGIRAGHRDRGGRGRVPGLGVHRLPARRGSAVPWA